MTRSRTLALLLLLCCSAGCASKPQDEGLRVGDERQDSSILGATFSDRFTLLPGGTMRIAAQVHEVAGDATITSAVVDMEAIAKVEIAPPPSRAIRVTGVAEGDTTLHVTTVGGHTFDAALHIEAAGASELFSVLRARSACSFSPDVWFDLRSITPPSGIVFDVSAIDHGDLMVAATTRTRSGARRSGWGGVQFSASESAIAVTTRSPSAFHFGVDEIEFVDTGVVEAKAFRGATRLSIDDASLPVQISEAPVVARVRSFLVSGGLREIAHPDPNTDGASASLSTVYLGQPRECADLIVIPFDADGRPILGARGRATVTTGSEHVDLRSADGNVFGLAGRSLGAAELRVEFGPNRAVITVDVVASSR